MINIFNLIKKNLETIIDKLTNLLKELNKFKHNWQISVNMYVCMYVQIYIRKLSKILTPLTAISRRKLSEILTPSFLFLLNSHVSRSSIFNRGLPLTISDLHPPNTVDDSGGSSSMMEQRSGQLESLAALFIGLSTQELPHEETTLQNQITVVEIKEHSEI